MATPLVPCYSTCRSPLPEPGLLTRFVVRFRRGEELCGRTPASSTGGALRTGEQHSQGRSQRSRLSRIAAEARELFGLGPGNLFGSQCMDSQALSLDEQFFLKIALKNGILDGDQAVGLVEEKLRLSSSGDAAPLDQLMRDKGFITETEVRKIREAQTASQVIRLDSQYADVAVERGLVDRDLIQWAFDRQREQRYSVRVGQLLVDAGHLEPSQHRELLEVLLKRMDDADQAPSPGLSPGSAVR